MEISNGVKIIVGLGNPGNKYQLTRHNAGWLALDYFVSDLGLKTEDLNWQKKFDAEILHPGHSDYILVKPQTFMNESGRAVKAICDFYKIDITANLLVIHDDTDLPLGTIRTTASSSAAGHNGVQDIIDKLGSQDFRRVRIGVESRLSRNSMPTDAFVLQNFMEDELEKLKSEVFPKVIEEIKKFLAK